MAGFIEAMRATLTELSGEQRRTPPALPSTLPPSVLPMVSAGVRKLISYQSPDYAQLYLDRLRRFAAQDGQRAAVCRDRAAAGAAHELPRPDRVVAGGARGSWRRRAR
ncbi:MAG: hypothetical protein MZV49_10460 [Rhodopseudomonas palustris]|nr:hypothetical protein [Rhodopseudomonas palustris]